MKDKKHKKKQQNSESSSQSQSDRQKRKKSDRSHDKKKQSKKIKKDNQKERSSRKQKKKKKARHYSSSQQSYNKDSHINSNKKHQRDKNSTGLDKIKKQNIEKQGNHQGWESSPEIQPNQKQDHQIKYQNLKQEVGEAEKQKKIQKQLPNFEPSGILLQYYNARQGVSLKFNEPAQAHKPLNEWRVYPFKQSTSLNPIILKQSCYLIGKDDRVCDILCQNSSISRQHAVIQFRSQYQMQIQGDYLVDVKPYIMDLQSTNGTFLNGEKIEPSRYYQLLNKDVLKFGLSQRQYVMFKVPNQNTSEQNVQQDEEF